MVLYKNKYINPFKGATKVTQSPALLQYKWNDNRYRVIRVYYAVTQGVSKCPKVWVKSFQRFEWNALPVFPYSVVVRCTGMLCSNAGRTTMMPHWVWAGVFFLSCQSFSLRLNSVSVKAAGPQLVIFWGPFGPEQTNRHINKKTTCNHSCSTMWNWWKT